MANETRTETRAVAYLSVCSAANARRSAEMLWCLCQRWNSVTCDMCAYGARLWIGGEVAQTRIRE